MTQFPTGSWLKSRAAAVTGTRRKIAREIYKTQIDITGDKAVCCENQYKPEILHSESHGHAKQLVSKQQKNPKN